MSEVCTKVVTSREDPSLQNCSVTRTVGQYLLRGKERSAAALTTVGRCRHLLGVLGLWSEMGLSLDLVSFAVSNVKLFPVSMQRRIPACVKAAEHRKLAGMTLHGLRASSSFSFWLTSKTRSVMSGTTVPPRFVSVYGWFFLLPSQKSWVM